MAIVEVLCTAAGCQGMGKSVGRKLKVGGFSSLFNSSGTGT